MEGVNPGLRRELDTPDMAVYDHPCGSEVGVLVATTHIRSILLLCGCFEQKVIVKILLIPVFIFYKLLNYG